MRSKDMKTMPLPKLSPSFIKVFLPIALITFLVSGLLIRMLYDNELSLIKLNESALLERSKLILQKNLQPPQKDLQSLRKEPPVIRDIEQPEAGLKGMETNFASILSRNPNYFQIRWIDASGRERLRLEPSADNPQGYRRIPNDQLQNKAGRYYFQATLALEENQQLYLSPMDLNIEYGELEYPLRPTLRMAIPVYHQNENRGVIIINIDAREYLSDLKQILAEDSTRIQLVNPDGYWLMHQNKNLEWGSQLGHGKAFKKEFPGLWRQMHSNYHYQILQNSEIWSWTTLYPNSNPRIFNNQTLGFLLLHQPATLIYNLRFRYWGGGALLTVLILLVVGVTLHRLLQAQQAQQSAEQQALENRIHAEQLRKQREDEQRFRVIFNASHTPLLVCDSKGNISLVNPALEKLFGYSAFELTGLPIEHLIPVELRRDHIKERTNYLSHLRPRRKLMKNGQSLKGLRKDGQEVDIEIGLSPYEVDDEIFILATLEDITGRVAAELRSNELHARQTRHLEQAREDAERLARLKSDFLANMSHEIRTPLNAIMVLGELLSLEALPDNARALSKSIQQAGDSLLHIVNDVLDFSKIEAGGLSIERTPFSLKETYGQLLPLCEAQANQKGLKLHLNTCGTERLCLLGDPYRLKQVLLNLVSNAIKFTREGRVNMHVQPLQSDSKEITLKFSVSDTGPGIPPEQQEVIFDAFAQADSSVTREFGGTGLGLAISRQLIQLMGGELKLTSQPGQGSTFWFTLSFPTEEHSLLPESSSVPGTINGPVNTLHDSDFLTGKEIMVVDDSEMNREIAQRIIQQAGGQVILADNGADAVAKIEAGLFTPALILMDLQMPIMDGYKATSRIRQLEGYHDIPVIALTAGVTEDARNQAIKCGANLVLNKPFTIQQIITGIQGLLSEPEASNFSDTLAKQENKQPNDSILPLLDEATALANWGDKVSLQQFLRQFASQYRHCAKELESLLIQGEFEKAEALTHKVKGAAASLYLCALRDDLEQLEQQLAQRDKQSETIIKQTLSSVSATLSKTLVLIADYN